VSGGNQLWFLDSGCSRHITEDRLNFLLLTNFDGGSVAFGNDKYEKIISVGKIGKSPSHSIDNVYLVDSLQHNLLSVSQLCDRGNHIGFTLDQCLITNVKSGNVALREK